MTARVLGAAVVVATAMCLAWTAPALGAAAGCSDFAPGDDCGGGTGDALCTDGNGMPDPLQDCAPDVDTLTCGCRPRVCCDCDSTTDGQISSCNLPCTETGIGLLACVSICALIDLSGEECELNIVNGALCEGDGCATTGCCTFNESSNARTASQNICVETDEDTCNLLGGLVVFTEGGSCVGGMFGTCTAPTPTSTPTSTATVPDPTSTPTNTLVPEGGDCTTPSECATGFCVDGVCCNTACDGPFDICNAPADPGVCTAVTAQAPAMSNNGLLIAFLVLIAVGGLTLLYRTRRA